MAQVDGYDACRRISHRWDELGGPPLGYEGVRRNAFWLRCERCGMLRAFEISPRIGEVIWSRYWAPKGYYWEGDGEAPTRRDYRLQWFKDVFDKRKKKVAG